MRRFVIVGVAATALSVAVPAVTHAQTTPPTTVENSAVTVPVNSTVTSERDVTVTTIKQVGTDNDDSDKTGLWGLLGLLGLAGLAGLKPKKRDDSYTTGTIAGDTTPRGSTTKP